MEDNNSIRFTSVVKTLLIINIILFAASFILEFMGIDLNKILGLYYFKSENFKPYQIITHMFMHGGIWHLAFNMFTLWMFGKVLETVWGGKRFLIYFFVTGLGAATLHSVVQWYGFEIMQDTLNKLIENPNPDAFVAYVNKYLYHIKIKPEFINAWYDDPQNTFFAGNAVKIAQQESIKILNIVTVGASGAVYGLLLAFGMLFPNQPLYMMFIPIPIKAKWMVIGFGVFEIILGLTNSEGDNIAHFAHLGGMLFGWIIMKIWYGKKIKPLQ